MATKIQLIIILLLIELVSYSQSSIVEKNREIINKMQNEVRAFVNEIQQSNSHMWDINIDPSDDERNMKETADKKESVKDNISSRSESAGSNLPDIYPIISVPQISSSYGYRIDPFTKRRAFHRGIDIAVPENTDVVSCGTGKVAKAAFNRTNGNYIIIDHNNNYQTYYGHLSKVLVKKGDNILKGQIIGKSGNTGRSTGPHIHYQINLNGKSIDPLTIIN